MSVDNFQIHERIKYLREEVLKIKQSEMSLMLNLKQGSLSDIERKKTKNVTDRVINDICRVYNVDETWLRTGEGEIFVQKSPSFIDEFAKQNHLTDLEHEILKRYMQLDPALRQQLMQHFKTIFSGPREESKTMESDVEAQIEAELQRYRMELEAELKGRTSSASVEREEKLS